ncbi:MAG: hypothetical protein CTY28_10215 [Hyphomicrobium sp.]|nr:MAG: hypothetical protein CTY28_10215 [Hyphomicrobium sp.]
MGALLNRARMTTATTGTGTITLGSAVAGFATFAEAGAANATVYSYCIEDGNDFEIGVGTYTSSGTTFSRDTVTLSKISGTSGTSKINLSGSATIFVTALVSDIGTAFLTANTFTATQTITPAANTNALAVTGYSLTGSNAQSLIDLAGTWNTSGTPTAFKLNITNTAANAAANLMDLQIGGVSQIRARADGSNFRMSGARFGGNVAFEMDYNGGNPWNFSVGGTQIWSFSADGNGLRLKSDQPFGWSAGVSNNSPDTILLRDAADTVAQRRGTNAQTFRVYETYTDASNYERASLSCASNTATLAAETAGTGSDDMDVALTPAGAGLVKFGTHSAIAAETVTGYITIKDAAGNSRKIAVVS